ncbi:hypothetical protein BGW38_004248 [Lunasporangiospora selenospora]|uniref:Nudix hydrolase domain-containing protein n=1 Tax=Lunasporangiospora selenospora TaxID=979761 RepID=A0A9P6KC97_9FUNG|nr:hypothetical protein BGW38_004248 [Lunasporangiospora selenospora]
MTREIEALASIINSMGPPIKVPSHPPKYRRAAVAIIIRIRPDSRNSALLEGRQIQALDHPDSLDEFFAQSWVQTGTPEVLFIERATRTTDRWSGHVALPGGKQELHEDDQDTAVRETLEEIGLDLSDPTQYRCVGQLDDRELWASFGRIFLMVLSPFVFIQLSPNTPALQPQPDEVASVHWEPLSLFLDQLESPGWTPMVINLTSKLAPKLSKTMLRGAFGTISLHAIEMPYQPEFVVRKRIETEEMIKAVVDFQPSWDPNHPPLRLWGLTLQMMADLFELRNGPVQMHKFRPNWDTRRMKKRLDGGFLPRFSLMGMDFWVRFMLRINLWQSIKNKSETSSRVGSWESYFRLVRRAFILALLSRAAILALLVKYLREPVLRLIKSTLSKTLT